MLPIYALLYPPGGTYIQSSPNGLPHEVSITNPITTTPCLDLMLKNCATKANNSSRGIFQIQSKILNQKVGFGASTTETSKEVKPLWSPL